MPETLSSSALVVICWNHNPAVTQVARRAYRVHRELRGAVCCAVCRDWEGESQSWPRGVVSLLCTAGTKPINQFQQQLFLLISQKAHMNILNAGKGHT